MGYSTVNVDELEPAGPGGAVRFVRRGLGVDAFGINWFDLAPNVEGPRARRGGHAAGGGHHLHPWLRRVSRRRRRAAGARGHDLPLRPRDNAAARRRARRDDIHRDRRASRELRAARVVLAAASKTDAPRGADRRRFPGARDGLLPLRACCARACCARAAGGEFRAPYRNGTRKGVTCPRRKRADCAPRPGSRLARASRQARVKARALPGTARRR